jgi:DNA-binding NarL/FixJ family response regulator
MTHVLVVHHDVDVADLEVDELRRAPCWMAERADVLVYDVWASGDDGRALIEDLREQYPDKPVVLTSLGMEPDWVTDEGVHRVTAMTGAPTRARLVEAIERALGAPTAVAAG